MERSSETRNILILGGTRFAGLALARRLLGEGHHVCVSSRRPEKAPAGAEVLPGERREVLRSLRGERRFDTLIDFTAYEAADTADALETLPGAALLLVSSTWLCKLRPGLRVDEQAPTQGPEPVSLPPVTRRYLKGKAEAEALLLEARREGRKVATLRLPILFGAGDHTGRVDFYRRRIEDGESLLLVNGGRNAVPLLWTEDAARVITASLDKDLAWRHPVADLLSRQQDSLSVTLEHLATAMGRPLRTHSVSLATLTGTLAEYLEADPWWREGAVLPGTGNLFAATGLQATPMRAAFATVLDNARHTPDALRTREILWLRAQETQGS